ncbi:MAG: M28 family peptidase [Acidobacteria bacterium]|nr:M28 family peptidase [Acidobacteriota bacterium]
MRRLPTPVVVLLLACLPAAAADTGLLFLVERQAPTDRQALLAQGLPVVAETNCCLLLEGTEADLARARALGLAPEVIDRDTEGRDYVIAGTRPDSDLATAASIATTLLARENWLLLRIPAGADLAPLAEARLLLSRVGHEPLAPPAPDSPAAQINAADPLVQKIVEAVSPAAVDGYWLHLTQNEPTKTRYSTSQGCRDAAAYCRDTFLSLGLGAELQTWSANHAPNAIGTRVGAINPDEVYIVIGHLDDLPSSGPAPGADDNASGTVNVLESARAMNCWAYKNTIKYIACTGEESGLLGSDAYAADALARGENIQGVINMDMIAWAGNGVPNPENLDLDYDGPSQGLAERFARCAGDYGTGLVVNAIYCPSLHASDHDPFWRRGWKAVCGITDNEGYCGQAGNYPYYHQSTDTIANCGEKAFFYSVVRTSVATLAELAQPFKVAFDRNAYACGSSLRVLVGDADLDTDPGSPQSVQVAVWSTTEPVPEILTLVEDGPDSMIFSGSLPTTNAPAQPGDGLLSIAAGDALHARYVDAFDCDGALDVPYEASALVDCVLPAISNVHDTGVSDTQATIQWGTDEASDSQVVWGPVPPPGTTTAKPALVTDHTLTLTGLSACTVYYYEVRSSDEAGNTARADNGGGYYHFETLGNFGSGLQPCHAGRVSQDAATWSCADVASFRLVDMDLNRDAGAAETAIVEVTSSSEFAGETVLLTETGPNSSTFTGSIATAAGAPVPDGLLQLAHGDTITVSYADEDDGTGATAMSFATALADCAGPPIGSLRVDTITDARATIRFTTAEPGDTVVEWGTTPALGQLASDAALTTSHALTLNRFDACGTAYFRVRSTDAFGNTVTADDGGAPFRFQTGEIPGLYWHDSFDKAPTGWQLGGEWEIGAPQGRGGSGGGAPDPAVAYNHSQVLGHDLTGRGTYPGDYEASRTEAATSPYLDATTWRNTKLLFMRRLNSGRNDDASIWIWTPTGLPVWRSQNQQVSEFAYQQMTYDVSAMADGKPAIRLQFQQKSDGSGQFSGWNIDEVIFKDGTLPDYGPCGGCGAAPSFAGATGATDDDPCADSAVTIRWNAAVAWGTADGGSYAVYRDTAPGFTPGPGNLLAHGVAGLSYQDLSAPPDQAFYYLVRAENNETCAGGPHNGGLVDANTTYVAGRDDTAQALPAEVAGMRVQLVGRAHVRLDWDAASGAAGYAVYRSPDAAPGDFALVATPAAGWWEDIGAGANRETYFYAVRGRNACGQEGP